MPIYSYMGYYPHTIIPIHTYMGYYPHTIIPIHTYMGQYPHIIIPIHTYMGQYPHTNTLFSASSTSHQTHFSFVCFQIHPGRFDRQIQVTNPDIKGRKAIFKVHLKDKICLDNVNDISKRMAALTPGI